MRKKAHRLNKVGKVLTIFFSLFVFVILLVGKATFDMTAHTISDDDYSDVIREGVGSNNPHVVDIAMLGAHDAFSQKINGRSKIDPAEDSGSILRNPVAKVLASGLFVRLARAQLDGPATMLRLGVRYFDVRISDVEGEWYTKHGLLSAPLSQYLDEFIPFLKNNPGEFIIFDMQHIYFDGLTFADLWTYLEGYEVDGFSLIDFVHFNSNMTALSNLTYDDVTEDGTTAGVVILAKTPVTIDQPYHYERGSGEGAGMLSIRSVWHETSDTETMLTGIRREVEAISGSNAYDGIFRVNQAQKTGKYSGSDVVDTLLGWSLIDLARVFNPILVNQEDFTDWLSAMPIVMVDFSTSSKQNFNQIVNDTLIEYNRSLSM